MTNLYVYSAPSSFGVASLLGILEGASAFRYERKLTEHNTFSLTIPRGVPGAAMIQRGRLLATPAYEGADPLWCLVWRIDQIETTTDEDGVETIKAQGRESGGLLDARIVEPPAGAAHDIFHGPAESAMKHYVSDHAGPTAANVKRRTPGLIVAPDLARGTTVHIEGRYQTVAALLDEIGLASQIGWEFRLNTTLGAHVFDTIHGIDRTATVTVDVTLDAIRAQKWLSSDVNVRTAAVVAGQGEGVDRQIVRRYKGGTEPTGWNRAEVFVDARDLNDTSALQTRGDATLQDAQVDDRFEANIYAFGPFRYQGNWDLGDIVRVRNVEWGIDRSMRVVSVTVAYSAQRGAEPEITVALDKPWPTLADRDQNSARSTGGAAAHGAVDYHSENHAARHALGGPDPITITAGQIAPGAVTVTTSTRQVPTAADQSVSTTFQPTDITGASVTFQATPGTTHLILVKAQAHHSAPGGRVQIDVANSAGSSVASAPFVGHALAGNDVAHTIVDAVPNFTQGTVTYRLRFMNVDAGTATVVRFSAYLTVVELRA